MKKVILSSSVNVLDNWSVRSCPNLTEVHFKSNTPVDLATTTDNRENFSSCNSNLKFYVPKGSKEDYLAATQEKGFANSTNNAYATSPEALAARVFEEDPDALNMLYVQGANFDGSSTVENSAVFIANRQIVIPNLYVSDHEVTQAEYLAVMGSNPSEFSSSPTEGEIQANRPVETVTWYNAVSYCNALSEAKNLTSCYTINGDNVTYNFNANGYRLPTEAEWEYIARGGSLTGTQTTYSGTSSDSELTNYAWYSGNTDNKTHEVKKKNANTLGIYDMSGNVYEWCWDWSGNITESTDAYGAAEGTHRVTRGGAKQNGAPYCTVSFRDNLTPSNSGNYLGFRVVRTAQ